MMRKKVNVTKNASINTTLLKKDPRPIYDKKFKESCIDQLLQFLKMNNYIGNVTKRSLMSPSSMEFCRIFLFLINYNNTDYMFTLDQKKPNWVDDLMDIIILFSYPYPLKKSIFVSIGSPHAWPQILAFFMWLIEIYEKDIPDIDVVSDFFQQHEFIMDQILSDTIDDNQHEQLIDNLINANQVITNFFCAKSYSHFMETNEIKTNIDIEKCFGISKLKEQIPKLKKEIQESEEKYKKYSSMVENTKKKTDYLLERKNLVNIADKHLIELKECKKARHDAFILKREECNKIEKEIDSMNQYIDEKNEILSSQTMNRKEKEKLTEKLNVCLAREEAIYNIKLEKEEISKKVQLKLATDRKKCDEILASCRQNYYSIIMFCKKIGIEANQDDIFDRAILIQHKTYDIDCILSDICMKIKNYKNVSQKKVENMNLKITSFKNQLNQLEEMYVTESKNLEEETNKINDIESRFDNYLTTVAKKCEILGPKMAKIEKYWSSKNATHIKQSMINHAITIKKRNLKLKQTLKLHEDKLESVKNEYILVMKKLTNYCNNCNDIQTQKIEIRKKYHTQLSLFGSHCRRSVIYICLILYSFYIYRLKAWGPNISVAFQQCAQAMFNYITPLEFVHVQQDKLIVAQGEDMDSLLYNFMDECLFSFCDDPYFITKIVNITKFDDINFNIQATLSGEEFSLEKHEQGTEVKAITYSKLTIIRKPQECTVFVIIDI
ncbi:hypothetical protein A3Q56_06133 [Intoshia linei]|uniref:Kinetochore protein NDC80 n=1 Tax=Intoshia linei TaxID=1819745 RepID=A0A177AXP4_9BILA|nr:hypothetical protein A3Q56_06133 [Intoshia linei]